MTREIEAIYEDGVLKPVEPLALREKQRVKVRVSDSLGPVEPPNARTQELAWLRANAHRYKGEYVAVLGNELITHGKDGSTVIADARAKGFRNALFHHVPEHLGEPVFELF